MTPERTTQTAIQTTPSRHASAYRLTLWLGLALFFFAVPHTLEDFALGEPAKAGIPAPLLSAVVSSVLAAQALGLYGLGQSVAGQARRWAPGLLVAVGVFWPLASGLAQLPALLSSEPYRSGAWSVLYVVGLMLTGAALAVSAGWSWWSSRRAGA